MGYEVAPGSRDDVRHERDPRGPLLCPLQNQTLGLSAVLVGEPAVPSTARRCWGRLVACWSVFQRHAGSGGRLGCHLTPLPRSTPPHTPIHWPLASA